MNKLSKRTVTKTLDAGKSKELVSRNPARTRAGLFAAGMKLFSAKGYDGVAVDEIVKRAGCNKRMLYHYFGSKKGLYLEVLSGVFAELEKIEVGDLLEIEDARKSIEELLERYFDFLANHPEFVSLVMWENLSGGRFLRHQKELIRKDPILEKLEMVLRKCKREGSIRQDRDPRHLLIHLIGSCFIYFSNRYTLSETVGLNLRDKAVLREGLRYSKRFVLEGVMG